MCAICGIINISGEPVSQDLLQTMARTMHHRGPDDEGYWFKGLIGLGFQRLSIIDLSGGHQPMSNEDDSLWIVFNGEIYNFQILRRELESTGRHHFKTCSDTEIILHLYEEYGEDCVQKLRGMFAFALWDEHKKQLFFGRDRLGKKPFFYCRLPHGIVFASEMKAILKHPAVPRVINPQALDLYLTYQYIPSPHTIFKDISKLPPAHYGLWKEGVLSIHPYWQLSFRDKLTLSSKEAITELMGKLRESVRLRMIADVPLGAFLSGGIDSSIVVGLMSEVSIQPVKTYAIGFEEQNFSELKYAALVAKRFGTDHHEFIVRPHTKEILPKLAWHYDEPFADPSALPSYFVARETRKHVTVALNGDGGDENFAGYYRYAAMGCLITWNHLPVSLRRAVDRMVSLLPVDENLYSFLWRLIRTLQIGADSPENQYLELANVFTEKQKRALYTPGLKQLLGTWDSANYLVQLLKTVDATQWLDRCMAADLASYLPECLMRKMDIASMANSLETRSPFLDHEFVELAARLPPHFKWRPFLRTKWILRHGFQGWLPEEILKRGKQGFGIPMRGWFRKELNAYLKEIVLNPKALARGYFDSEVIKSMIRDHENGKADHSHRLWTLLMLELWHKVYIDREYTFP